MVHQETEGFLSPFIRDIRLKKVASQIEKNSTILDIACGNGYLSKFLPSGCKYYGVDIVPSSSNSNFTGFLSLNLTDEQSYNLIAEWIPEKIDYITCNAFLEHIENPGDFVMRYQSLLEKKGKFIGTTPHPSGKTLHKRLSQIYICSRHGAEEHKDYLERNDIAKIASETNGNLTFFKNFLFGLNQLFVIDYSKLANNHLHKR